MVIVTFDQVSKITIPLRKRMVISSPHLVRMVFDPESCKHCIPNMVVTDHAILLTSQFDMQVCSVMSIIHQVSTAIHPQSNGQTECQNQTMAQYLQDLFNYKQDNWIEPHPQLEFAYHDSAHEVTRMELLLGMYKWNPQIEFYTPEYSHTK